MRAVGNSNLGLAGSLGDAWWSDPSLNIDVPLPPSYVQPASPQSPGAVPSASGILAADGTVSPLVLGMGLVFLLALGASS